MDQTWSRAYPARQTQQKAFMVFAEGKYYFSFYLASNLQVKI